MKEPIVEVFRSLDINVFNENGSLRNLPDVLNDLGDVWDLLAKDQQRFIKHTFFLKGFNEGLDYIKS